MIRYPSDIVDQVFGLEPDKDLVVWEGETKVCCNHCARPVAQGEFYNPSSVGQFFSDTRDLASSSMVICWRCVILRKKPMLNGLGASVTTPDGVFSISKDVNKAWLFTTPPPAPFVVVHSSSTMQHLVWRTPVTLDNRFIQVRFGPRLFTVQPAVIRKALAIADAMNADQKKWINPLLLDRKAAQGWHGMLNPRAADLLTDEDAHFLSTLSPGDKWALAFLMHSKRPQPEQSEPIHEKILAKL